MEIEGKIEDTQKMYKYYVVYCYEGIGWGCTYMSSPFEYNTQDNIEALRQYLTEHATNGKPTIVVNIIKCEE